MCNSVVLIFYNFCVIKFVLIINKNILQKNNRRLCSYMLSTDFYEPCAPCIVFRACLYLVTARRISQGMEHFFSMVKGIEPSLNRLKVPKQASMCAALTPTIVVCGRGIT